MKIYLVRHGESTSDVEDKYGGVYDDHLTKSGKDQAKELAVKLSDKNIEAIFSSPLLRAKETAEIIQKQVGSDIRVIEGIRERNRYAHLTGMKKVLAKIRYPEQVAKLESPEGFVDGGEDYESFRKRIVVALDEVAGCGLDNVVLVAHGGPIRCIFREILKLGEFSRLEHCAIFEIESKDGFKLVSTENAELEE